MMGISNLVIGRNIRKARKTLCLTQEKTAELMGLSVLHFGRLERGERTASLRQLDRLSEILDVPLEALLSGATDRIAPSHDELCASSAAAISQMVTGCSAQGQYLMLNVYRMIAHHDKLLSP